MTQEIADSEPANSLRPLRKSERTRERILLAAEGLFAAHGFGPTRVEAIATAAEIRRATLFYYFRDKPEIYQAVLERLFAPLLERMQKVFSGAVDDSLIERAISTFFDALAERPAIARIVLREIADTEPGEAAPILRHIRPIASEVETLLAPLRSAGVDPIRLILAVTGASVFFVSAMPLLSDAEGNDSRIELERHKAEVARLVRRQLGLPYKEHE